MKTSVLNIEGKKLGKIDLPGCFDEKIRKDIIKKAFEAELSEEKQPYGSFYLAGKQASASGILKHRRKDWKTTAGHGISRIPRKIMSKRGSHFGWEGAFVSGARGGKQAHPPKSWKVLEKKINKKERAKAIRGSIAATANSADIINRYKILKESANAKDIEKIEFPLVVESKINDIKKTSELRGAIEKILSQISGSFNEIALREKKVRAGKGKMRNRFYKLSRGVLIVTSKDEINSAKGLEGIGIDFVNVKKLKIGKLAPGGVPGRLTIYTEDAINEMKKIERLK